MSFSRTKKRSKNFLTVLLIMSFINCFFPGNLFALEPKGYIVSVNQGDSSFPDSSLIGEPLIRGTDESVTSVYKKNNESVTTVYEEESDIIYRGISFPESLDGSLTPEAFFTGGHEYFIKSVTNRSKLNERRPVHLTPSKALNKPSDTEDTDYTRTVTKKTNEFISNDIVIIDEDIPVNFDYLRQIKPADEETEDTNTIPTVIDQVYADNTDESTYESVADEVYTDANDGSDILPLIEEKDTPVQSIPSEEPASLLGAGDNSTIPIDNDIVYENNTYDSTSESVIDVVYQEVSEDNGMLSLIEEEDSTTQSTPSEELVQPSDEEESKTGPTVNETVYEINTEDLDNKSFLIKPYPEASEDEVMFPITNEAAYLDVDFTSKTENTLFMLTCGKASLSVSAINPVTVKSEVYGNESKFDGIYPDTDILYKAEKHRLKEDIIVHKYNGISDFNFELKAENAVYQMMPEGIVLFSDPDSGMPLFYMDKPFAVDNNGERSDEVYLELAEDGSLKLSVDPEWLKNAAYPVTIDPTIWLCDAGFSRTTLAYKQNGTSVSYNIPRYETGKYSQAIMIEEGTTNILSANQSSIETSLPTGFVGDGGTVTRSTATYRSGAACMKIDANTSDPWGGADLWNNATGTAFSVTPGATYTVSFYAKGVSGGENILIRPYKTDFTPAANGTSTTLNSSTWSRLTNTFTVPAGCSSIYFILRKNNVSSAISWYVDCLQFEQKPYGTSWMNGGSRAAERLTVKTNGIFNKSNWAVDMWYIPKLVQNTTQQILWYTNIDGNNRYRIWVDSAGRINGGVGSAGTYYDITSPTSIAPESQYFITLTGDGTTLRLMVNGSEVGNRSYLEPVGVLPTNMYFGSDQNTARQANGLLDDVRISNRARTLAEHQSLYNSSSASPVDAVTTCKMSFNSNLKVNTISADDSLGIEPYWNYVTRSLGGGWTASVNTVNFNLVLSKTLFSIPGRGIPIGESITYNSTDRRVGPLGKCWHLGNDISLTEYQDPEYPPGDRTCVLYNSGDGSSHIFTPNGSGGFDHPPGIYLLLEKDAQGRYTITDRDFNVYSFDSNNRISSIVDRNDNTTTFIYGTVNGRLYQVSDPSDRRLTYDYNSKGQLRNITDPDNHTYQMNYQNDYLTSITDPDNKTYTFNYTDILGNDYQCMYTFTDPLNQVTKFINYGSSGKIYCFEDARTNGQDYYDTTFIGQPGENGELVVTVTDPRGHIDTYYHDGNTGNLIKYTDQLGHSWEYTWNNNNLENVLNDIGGNTHYSYDNSGNLRSKRTKVDDVLNNDIVENLYYDSYNQLDEFIDGEGRNTSYRYSNKGNVLSILNQDCTESNGRKYDEYGNVIEYSQMASSSYNLLRNGSFENSYSHWDLDGSNMNYSIEDYIFHPYGSSSLKLENTAGRIANGTFYQRVNGIQVGDMLTLRVNVNCEMFSDDSYALIRLDNGYGVEERIVGGLFVSGKPYVT